MKGNFVAGLDPRSKWLAFICIQVVLLMPVSRRQPSMHLLLVFVPLAVLLLFAGKAWRLWLRCLALAAPLLALLIFSGLLPPTANRSPLPPNVLIMAAKAILVFLALALFILNEKPSRMFQALQQMQFPKTVITILFIGYRFACQWQLELEGVRCAWTARNFSALSKIKRIRHLGGAVPLFFDRWLEGSVHVHDAMISRGFNGSIPAWERLVFSSTDMIFLALFVMTLALPALLP